MLCPLFNTSIIYAFGMLFVVFAGIDSTRRLYFVAFAFVCFLMLEKVFFLAFFKSHFQHFPSSKYVTVLI